MPLPHTISPEHFDEVFRLAPNAWVDVVYGLARSLGLPQAELETFPDGSNLLAALGPHILKIFPPFHRHQWESERRALAALQGRVSVRIPTLWAEGELQGWTWLHISRLPGRTLERCWPDWPRGRRLTFLETLGRAMAEVHEVPLGELVSLPPDWERFFAGQREGGLARHRRLGAPAWLLEELPDFVAQTPLSPAPHVLLTGEYTPFNLLVEGDDWAMIDFGDCMVGPAPYDLLGPILFLAAGDAALQGALLRGYGLGPSPELRRSLLLLTLLHRYSNLDAQLRLPGWRELGSLSALERRIMPWEDLETPQRLRLP